MICTFNLVMVVIVTALVGAVPQDDEAEYFELDQEDVGPQLPISSSFNPDEDLPVINSLPQFRRISAQENS